MRKRIKKCLTMLLALAVMLGTVDYSAWTVQAAEEQEIVVSADDILPIVGNITPEGDKSFKGDQLTKDWGNATNELVGDQWVLGFAAQYDQIKLKLPETINLANCNSVTFAVSAQNCPLAFKLYEANGDEIVDYSLYSQSGQTLYTFDLTSWTQEIAYIGIMHNEAINEGASCTFDGVMFDMVDDSGEDEDDEDDDSGNITPDGDKSFKGDKLAKDWGSATNELVGDQWVLGFAAQYDQIKLNLPENINLADCNSVTFAVSAQNCPIAFKLYESNGNEIVDYSLYSQSGQTLYTFDMTTWTQEISAIGIMHNEAVTEGASCTFDGVMFDMVDDSEDDDDDDIDPSENITPPAEGEEDFSWMAGDLTKNYDTTSSPELDEALSRWNLTFTGAWQEVRFDLPQAIDVTQCNSLTVAISDQSSNLSFKVYTADGEMTDWSKYHQKDKNLYEYNFTGLTGEIVSFAIMLHSNDLVNASETCAFDGLLFDMMTEEDVVETYEVTYGANDLTFVASQGSATSVLSGNVHSMTFGALNDENRYTFPEVVNLAKCVSITVKVTSQTGPVNFYLASGNTKIESFYYNVDKSEYLLIPSKESKVDSFIVQCGGESYTPNSALDLESVTFVMEGREPLPTPEDGIYTYAHFIDPIVSDDVTVTVDPADYSATIAFANAGGSVLLAVPDAIDVNHLVSIDMLATGNENVTWMILDADGNEIITATSNSVETKCNPEVAYIKLVSNAATTMELTGFRFNVDPNAFEAIVLNGNFARDDVSMWGAAIWGSVDGVDTTITTAVSDTPIYDDVYTYGVISRRSSSYVCFAQDVSDRVQTDTTYQFTYYAKMSDDYDDARQTLSMVGFEPYYVDTNGKTNYGMKVLGNRVHATNDGWVRCQGVMYVPKDAASVVIRLVEQGTNYGQGECLMGSYYITGVKMEPYTYYWGGGGGGNNTNTTITKEATWIGDFDMDDLLVEWASATYNKKGEKLEIGFTNNYDEVRMDLPREYDMSTAAYIKTRVTSNVPIAVKLYYKGKQVDVGYYNTIQDEYVLVPAHTGMVDAIGIMSLATPNPEGAFAIFNGITFGLTQEPAPLPPRTSIVLNGDFANEDLSDWMASYWGDGVTMTRKTSSTPIAEGVTNYASYSKRTSPYQCFAQDITEAVVEGETYTFSFWARLSEAYEGAPESQRIIQFGPYTVDSDGNSDYNPRLSGTYLQVCEPGVWTYFEGTYKVTNPNDVAKVVIRILEQGTNYGQGECVLGGFDIADVKMEVYVPEPPSIDEDVPNLKDALAEDFGDDFWTGTAVTLDEMEDIGVEMLLNKHFNAVTLGNELKPDALFNYSNNQHTELKTITFNGQQLVVPTLYFDRADEMLDTLLEWNATHPESPVMVKGHVLVWHSQTPEWFFREDYVVGNNADGTPNYVSKEEMNLRLEWFISTVLEHYLGEDSPYKDMFYAWDVVNEAVSNGNSGYRTDKASSVEDPNADTHSSNSSWWGVYQSNEYIINAFKYANMYAPEHIELYYNDYNECDSGKMRGIVQLLTDVKNAEGTRIDGMGMQGHYNMFNPSPKDIEKAIRAYAAVVGKVNYSELDMKVSGDISTEEKLQKEYLAQAERYHNIYQVLLKLDAEEGIDISGITWWGTVDHHSWLQSSSGVGGGADGTMTQCPLLFDTKYKVKPSYWAFVDYTMVDPDWVPEEDASEKKEPAEDAENTDTKAEEDTTTKEDSTEAPAQATPDAEETTSDSKGKKSSAAPFAVAGGVGAAIIAASAAILFRKKSPLDDEE